MILELLGKSELEIFEQPSWTIGRRDNALVAGIVHQRESNSVDEKVVPALTAEFVGQRGGDLIAVSQRGDDVAYGSHGTVPKRLAHTST